MAAADQTTKPAVVKSCLLDVPKDGQFRNRSKSLDDGTRKTAVTVSGSTTLDSGDAYKIFESILKEGILITNLITPNSTFNKNIIIMSVEHAIAV